MTGAGFFFLYSQRIYSPPAMLEKPDACKHWINDHLQLLSQYSFFLPSLSIYIHLIRCWRNNSDFNQNADDQWLQILRQRKCLFQPRVLLAARGLWAGIGQRQAPTISCNFNKERQWSKEADFNFSMCRKMMITVFMLTTPTVMATMIRHLGYLDKGRECNNS